MNRAEKGTNLAEKERCSSLLCIWFGMQKSPIMKDVSSAPSAFRKHLFAAAAVSFLFTVAAHAQIYTLDHTNATLSGGAFVSIPDQWLYIPDSGSATAVFNMIPGKYIVSVNRSVLSNGAFGYPIKVNDDTIIVDTAIPLPGQSDDTFYNATFYGYYIVTGDSPVTVTLAPGGPFASRVSNVTFTLTNDIYFDENTPGVLLEDSPQGPITVPGPALNSILNSADVNFTLVGASGTGTGFMFGTIDLVAGQQYAVYASREVNANQVNQLSFHLTLDDGLAPLFSATVDGMPVNVVNGGLEQTFVGTYTPQGNSVDVLIDQPGAFAARMDYIRFVAIPEPGYLGPMVIAACGLAGFLRYRRRRAARTAG